MMINLPWLSLVWYVTVKLEFFGMSTPPDFTAVSDHPVNIVVMGWWEWKTTFAHRIRLVSIYTSTRKGSEQNRSDFANTGRRS